MARITHADCGGTWVATDSATLTCDRCGKGQDLRTLLGVPIISACQFEQTDE